MWNTGTSAVLSFTIKSAYLSDHFAGLNFSSGTVKSYVDKKPEYYRKKVSKFGKIYKKWIFEIARLQSPSENEGTPGAYVCRMCGKVRIFKIPAHIFILVPTRLAQIFIARQNVFYPKIERCWIRFTNISNGAFTISTNRSLWWRWKNKNKQFRSIQKFSLQRLLNRHSKCHSDLKRFVVLSILSRSYQCHNDKPILRCTLPSFTNSRESSKGNWRALRSK